MANVPGANFRSFTTANRDALVDPKRGTIIDNQTTNTLDRYNGLEWESFLTNASIPFVTVGSTNGTYATVKSAFDAGERYLIVIEDTTETATTNMSANDALEIKIINGVTWDLDTFQVAFLGNNCSLLIDGPGKIQFGYAATGAAIEQNFAFTGGVFYAKNLVIENSSTANDTFLTLNIQNSRLSDFYYILPNQSNAGPNIDQLDNGVFEGGGSACHSVFSSNSPITNIILKGSFATATGTSNSTCRIDDSANGIEFEGDGNDVGISFGRVCSISSVSANGSSLNLYSVNGGGNLSNIDTNDGEINTGGFDAINFSNVYFRTLTLSTSDGINMVNCNQSLASIGATTAITSTFSKFTNIIFIDDVAVDGDDNGFVNCQVGIGSGGTRTITINASANRTRISCCATDAAIVDSGTASAIDPVTNTVF